MKRKNPKFVGMSIFFILLGPLFPIASFLSNPFGASFFYSFFIGGSFIWLAVTFLDARTQLTIMKWERALPTITFHNDIAVISIPRMAAFYAFSGPFFVLISIGLTPWLFPGVFFDDGSFPSIWHLISIFIILPTCIYMFFLFTSTRKISVSKSRTFIKNEVRGLGWNSELTSINADLDLDVHHSDHMFELIASNVNYTRKSIFGVKKKEFKKKSVTIPNPRNIQLEEFLPWLFPEQLHLLPLMFDLIAEPRPSASSRSAKARKIREELTRKQEELRRK
jgi:hypothetical protein